MKYLKPLWAMFITLLLVGCTLSGAVPVTVVVITDTPPPAPTATATPPPTPTLTPTPFPYPWTDETATMGGICFEAAQAVAGQVFVLRSAADHIRLYNAADSNGQCRRPVTRNPFEFAEGARLLAGLWSAGRGCTARHDIADYLREGDTLRVTLRFVTEGDCNYELVQPFWIGVEGVTDVQFVLEGAQ